jgi:hypothetical protein
VINSGAKEKTDSWFGETILRTILKFGKKGYSSYKVQVLNQSSQ